MEVERRLRDVTGKLAGLLELDPDHLIGLAAQGSLVGTDELQIRRDVLKRHKKSWWSRRN